MIAANTWVITMGYIGLYDVGIGDAQVDGKAGKVQVPHFLSDLALEVANGEVVDEGHLGLNPVSEGFV